MRVVYKSTPEINRLLQERQNMEKAIAQVKLLNKLSGGQPDPYYKDLPDLEKNLNYINDQLKKLDYYEEWGILNFDTAPEAPPSEDTV